TYTVTAVNEARVESGASQAASVTIPAATDTTAPSTPLNVVPPGVTDHAVTLRWSPSTDNVGVAYYEVCGGPQGTLIVDPTATALTITGLQSSTAQSLYVLAFD